MSLTRHVRHRCQLLRPVLGDLDHLLLLGLALGRHPLLGRVPHDLLQVVAVERVEDVEEVLAVWDASFRQFCRKIPHRM